MVDLIVIISILFFAIMLEEKYKIPSPLNLITLSFCYICYVNSSFLNMFSEDGFVKMLIFLLPTLILADVLTLKLKDLRDNILHLLYLACFAIIISVLLAIVFSDYFFNKYELNIASIVLLFSMLLATDPISVISILKNAIVSHKLKILAEGESLFNDAMALIIFNAIGLYMLRGNILTYEYVAIVTLETFVFSMLIGVVIGIIGYMVYKLIKNLKNILILEFLLILIMAYTAFLLAEHTEIIGNNHLSGILAEITTILVFKFMFEYKVNMVGIKDEFDENEKIDEKFEKDIVESVVSTKNNFANRLKISIHIDMIKKSIENMDRHKNVLNMVSLLALIANAILFISMAKMIDLSFLLNYSKEIITIFVITTIIRAIVLLKFTVIVNKFSTITINFRWLTVLVLAGIKGGISIIMLHLIPNNFIFKDMFKAIVIGNVLLSTFVYSILLLLVIYVFKSKFQEEVESSQFN